MQEQFVNKVAESGIITLDLEKWYPKGEIVEFDLKPYLFMELILKEKDFRQALINTDWNLYNNKHVIIHCSADAIIPMWAYMLVAVNLEAVALQVAFGTKEKLIENSIISGITQLDTAEFIDKRVVIKGCGDVKIPETAYVAITHKLKPVVKSIMYGEPCSTVPIFKKK